MSNVRDIYVDNCTKCFYCKTTTSKTSGEWGKDVWIKNYCTLHNESVSNTKWCIMFVKRLFNQSTPNTPQP